MNLRKILKDVPISFNKSQKAENLREAVAVFEDMLIRKALEHTEGNISQAAHFLQLHRTTLVEKMKKRGISADEYRALGEHA